MHATSSAQPMPTEEETFGFTAAEWTCVVVDPKTGKKGGNVVATYELGAGYA